MDWADDEAARYIMAWAIRWPTHEWDRTPVSIVAQALRKAKADGMREAADMVASIDSNRGNEKVAAEAIRYSAASIERGDDA